MNTYSNAPTLGRRRLSAKSFSSFANLLTRWAARSQQRYLLRDMDDHLLRDMGISRADAVRESMKPFWQD